MSITPYLPEIYLLLFGFSVFMYAVLDGYDLGVGMLLPSCNQAQRDRMIASIGPFWDANETWLVLAVGLLLIAFPAAHSMILTELYLPTSVMLAGLILRGVSFDFRAKVKPERKDLWDRCFKAGSFIASMTQGYMIGRYVLAFDDSTGAYLFALLSGLCVTAAYIYIGGTWLVMKTEGDLQKRAAKWSRRGGWLAALGVLAISIVNPLVSETVAERWFGFPEILLLAPVPLVCLAIMLLVDRYLRHVPVENDVGYQFPFIGAIILFAMSFFGLAYSFFPDIIPGVMTAKEAASATGTLLIVGYGAMFVLPMIFLYTLFVYRVFSGKATELNYE
ncbi:MULTISPECIES: cytochrome d ubiquinol oxidase subunit II [Salinivibrio]|jgi:cytochrome d ubiquinol oxidase subunit II|uniref:cytochrome d ubiquinol oxidase subunit II n=1 Tax=Salinivibrio TaxID=51366 RepID=UPI00084C667C|nr:cytochrome d ubiquinol oxidase subunit II [Salinivibrio sp. DV]OOF11312.1 cytochrome d ubiquinol oxidase subunit II [Salinivibrio sp. PR5]OOF15661.1 cytochrome d ubiquinol oxidase subunit II [Salinivibrio sp. PR932]OOF21758.1 cytochrome d ubiquinol oxidase subunit II [Salinivibrio sp. IB872]OOF25427.1 cytochrome d ubiquinol oxidase subunit II [Salinivibrio proteolyticus]PCE69275.1 cytochrome d ubiquinol oxidase subunit II [Salinivibrio sp. YCSC6]